MVRGSQWLLRCAVVFALSAAGCASDDGAFEEDADAEGKVKSHATPLAQELGNGAFFADVKANGSGCPEGSWSTSISPDGKVFTTTFSQYEVSVDEGKDLDLKACQIIVKLRSPSGMSYAVSNFSYSGYSFLDPGVSVSLGARYYFQGVNVGPDSSVKNLDGPVDQTYLYEDQVQTKDFVWSPCGAERELNIPTRLRMVNSNPRRNGYTNLAAIDARTEGKIVFQLNWRECK